MRTTWVSFSVWVSDGKVQMRQLKGRRKKISVHNRGTCFKYIHVVFQKAYVASTGEPKQRFETACAAVDETLKKMVNAEPQKRSFYMLVLEDFKKYLISMADNEAAIKKAVEERQPVAGEVGTVNV